MTRKTIASVRRTPQQQADVFVAANRKHLVVAGVAIGDGGKGCRYKLEDHTWHRLGREAHALLPNGFPKWEVGGQ